MIAKVMWRVYHEQAQTFIKCLKKEENDKIMRIFGQKGVFQDWAEKKGIKLEYKQLDVYPEKIEVEDGKGMTPAE